MMVLIHPEGLSNITESTRKGMTQRRWAFSHSQKRSLKNHEGKPKRGTLQEEPCQKLLIAKQLEQVFI
jgi:hypothetical protein